MSKYKDALERARKYWESPCTCFDIDALIEIFPELKDSDDRIRKLLIKHLEKERGSLSNDEAAEAIAWLEKQKPEVNVVKFKPGNKVTNGINIYTIDSIEDDYYRTKDGINIPFNLEYRWKIVENELKPTDNAEPKFESGKWIVWQNKCYKVNYNGCGYELIDQNGLRTSLEYGTVNENAHLWSIKDAKPGDILYCESGGTEFFIILKDISKNGIINSYCRYNDSIGFGIDIPNVMRINDNPKPATKEQCNFLFQKINESGYTWSEETHELKKIESAKSESEEELSDFEAALFSAFSDGWQQYLHGEEVDVVQWAKEHSAELLKVANQNYVAWRKEDEVKINRIVSLFENLKVTENDILRKDIDWLKSLRPQINVTDEELAQARKEAYNEVLDKIEYHDDWPTFDAGWDAAIWYLKKRNTMPQNQWKPSEEQITWLYRAADEASKDSRMKQILNELLSDLKKLTK